MIILIPQGIGDSVWALHKVQDVAQKKGDGEIHLRIACYKTSDLVETRALDFVKMFSFVKSAKMYKVPILLPGPPADSNGYYRYMPDGHADLPDIEYVLMPNAPLEKGIRLENWLPEFQINWNIMNDFKIDPNDIAKADSLRQAGEYVIFYLGPELGNTGAGHNRGSIWKPEDWIKLGDRIKQELKVKIVVVGAEYDRSYFDKYLKGRVDWTNLIGLTSVSHLFAVVKNSRLTISYQSGVGIMSSYLGIPTGIFWRARGDSVSSDYYISFDEGMASAWVNPDMLNQKKHLPLIYGRHDSEYIMQEIKERKW